MTRENSPDTDDSEMGRSTPPPKIVDMLQGSFEPARLDPPPIATIPLVKNNKQSEARPPEEDADDPEETPAAMATPAFWSDRRNTMLVTFGAAAIFILVLAVIAAHIGREAIRRREQRPSQAETAVEARSISGEAAPVAGIPVKPRFGIPTPPSISDMEAKSRAPMPAALPTKLQIVKAALCRNVTGFARYESLTETRLRARHLPLVQLYVEFEGPQPEIREDGRHVYRLAQEIRMARSDSVRGEALLDTTVSLTEVAMGPKRDFFASQYLRPTRTAEPGNYLIEVRLTDQVDNTSVSAKIPVTIVAE